MKRRIVAALALVCLCLALPFGAAATESSEPTQPTEAVREPGWCGESITWTFSDGVLTLSGSGEMDDYDQGEAPWEEHKQQITRVVLSGGITYIGSYAFYDYDGLTEVDFGGALYEIGSFAFYDCDGLTSISMPASFRIFGERCFSGSNNIKEIHCACSKFPKFRESCLWDVYCKIYFPAETPWGVKDIQTLEEAFKGRIEFLASDGTDPYVPTEPTEAPTEAPTTVPPTTVPPTTEAPTEPETQPPVTEPQVTEPAPMETAPEATAPEAPETEPKVPEKPEASLSPWWLALVIAVLAVLTALVLARKPRKKRRGKYSR